MRRARPLIVCLLAAGLALAPPLVAPARAHAPAAPKPAPTTATHWVYKLEASRPDLMATLTPAEGRLFEAHQRHLRHLRATKRLVLAGVCEDFAFGIVVFRAADAAEARRLVAADPIVAGGVLKADLHPFSPPLGP